MSLFARNRMIPAAALLSVVVVLAFAAMALMLPRATGNTSGVGGPFALIDENGKIVTEAALKGHPTLVFFGYTHCPDVCPATLSEISSVFKVLGPKETARAIFITVDPERDTPVVMRDYLTSFDPRITGLSGSSDAIKKVEDEYKAYAKAVPDKDGTYSMDHTAITYLMDKHGNFVGGFNLDQPPEKAAAELKTYD